MGGGGQRCPPGPVPARTAAAGAPPWSVPTLPSLCPLSRRPSPPPRPHRGTALSAPTLSSPSLPEASSQEPGPEAHLPRPAAPACRGVRGFGVHLSEKHWAFLFLEIQFTKHKKHPFKVYNSGTFLVVRWLRLCPSTAGGHGFNPWLGN